MKLPPPITPDLGRAPLHPKLAPDERHAIVVLVRANPKEDRASEAYRQFELMRSHATVGAFRRAGGSRTYLNYEVRRGRVEVRKG